MKENIVTSIDNSLAAISQLKEETSLQFIDAVAYHITNAFAQHNKVIIAGNGGSLCDAMHFAEELTGFFRSKRPALPAIALADPGHISCVGNDVGFDSIFSRGIEAHGQEGDVFIGLTTSGNSPNIINAFLTAKEKKLATVAFLGKGGGKLAGVADYELIINGFDSSDRIQEAHMAALHIIVEIIEKRLFDTGIFSANASSEQLVSTM